MKNHKQIEAQRRDKTAKRAKRKKGYIAPPLPKHSPVERAHDAMEAQKDLWLTLHGLNYLASDFETGTWKPVVDIYAPDYDMNSMPTGQEVLLKLHSEHYDTDKEQWSDLGKLLVAWCSVDPETMRIPCMVLISRLGGQANVAEAVESLVQPHHPKVWEFFQTEIRNRIVIPQDKQEPVEAESTTPLSPEETHATSADGEGTVQSE